MEDSPTLGFSVPALDSSEDNGIDQFLNASSLVVVQGFLSPHLNHKSEILKQLEDQEKVNDFLRIELSNLRAEKFMEVEKLKSQLEEERKQRTALTSRLERLINLMNCDITALVSNVLWLKLTSRVIDSTVFPDSMKHILLIMEEYLQLKGNDNNVRLEKIGRILEQLNAIFNVARKRFYASKLDQPKSIQCPNDDIPDEEENLEPVLQIQSSENSENQTPLLNGPVPRISQIRPTDPTERMLLNQKSQGRVDSTLQPESARNPSIHREDKLAASPNSCVCGISFATKRPLHVHIRSSKTGKSFKCYVCSRMFGTNAYLRRHIRNVHKHNIGYKCTSCKESFTLQDDFLNHRLKIHGEDKCVGTLLCAGFQTGSNNELV